MGVTISENLTALVSACILTVSSAVTISEASPAHVDLNPNVSDSVTVGENTAGITDACKASTSDSISASEDLAVSNEFLYASTSTPVPITENIVSAVEYLPISESESISTSESVEISLSALSGETSATISVTESVNAETTTPEVFDVHKIEEITLSEFIKPHLLIEINVSDGIIIGRTSVYASDSVATGEWVSLGVNIVASESVSALDVADALVEFLSSVASESITLSEFIDTLKHLYVDEVSDSISTSDSASASILECNADVSDPISLEDEPEVVLGDYAFSIEETIPITENVDVDITSLPADGEIADAISIAENVVIWIEITIDKSESISIGEDFVITLSDLAASTSESLSVSDPIDLDLWRTFSVVDSASISDQAEGVVPTVPIDASDSISIGEVASLFRGIAPSDLITITESVKLRFSYPPTTPTKAGIRRIKEYPYPDFGEFRL